MLYGALVHVQLTGLLAFTTRKSKDLIPDFIRSAQKLWILLLRTGFLKQLAFFSNNTDYTGHLAFTCLYRTRNVNCSNLEIRGVLDYALRRRRIHWNSWVHDWQVLSNERKLIIKGKVNNSIFTRKHLNFETIALKISFSCVPRSNEQCFRTTPQGVCDQCAN